MIEILMERFQNNMHRHPDVSWESVLNFLNDDYLKTLKAMEDRGGEPDLYVLEDGSWIYVECSKESPLQDRSITYDQPAEDMRTKKNVFPNGNALTLATKMGATLLDEDAYLYMQKLEDFDTKTSSWLLSDAALRKQGGAIYGEKRFGRAFIGSNGAQSFYGVRGFRGMIKL